MKIACIGNTNNMLFTLCRYLRDEGHDARLFLFNDEAEHFLPGADSYNDDYKKYTTTLEIGKATLFFGDKVKKASTALGGFDFFIGTDIAPALMALMGKTLDIFVPHGSDIYAYPFEKTVRPGTSKVWWLQATYYVAKVQKKGIEKTRLILFPDEYDQHFPFKQKLKTKGEFYSATVPMLYVPQYREANQESYKKLVHFETFNGIRSANDFVLFSHARQNGANLPEHEKIHEKGNHKLIRAFAEFLKQRPDLKCCLVLFEYGMDIDSAKQLVAQLEISENVKWMPKMQRREILYGLRLSDIACGEFENSWLTCGVVNETLAAGKPLMHYRDDKMYEKDYTELYPILNAKSENEILQQLLYFAANRPAIEKQFEAAAPWIEKHTVAAPLQFIKEFMNKSKPAEQPGLTEKMRLRLIRVKCAVLIGIHKTPGKLRKLFGKNLR